MEHIETMGIDQYEHLEAEIKEIKESLASWGRTARRVAFGGIGSVFVIGITIGGAWLQIDINAENEARLESLLAESIKSTLTRADYDRLRFGERELNAMQFKMILEKIEDLKTDHAFHGPKTMSGTNEL